MDSGKLLDIKLQKKGKKVGQLTDKFIGELDMETSKIDDQTLSIKEDTFNETIKFLEKCGVRIELATELNYHFFKRSNFKADAAHENMSEYSRLSSLE